MSKTIKVIKPDGKTQTYEGTFDPEKRLISTTDGKRVSPGANDTIEEGACFIATAVYNGEDAHQVQVLRKFRDTVILPSGRWGQNFISLYVWAGPYGARLIRQFPYSRKPLRYSIDRVVNLIERKFNIGCPGGKY